MTDENENILSMTPSFCSSGKKQIINQETEVLKTLSSNVMSEPEFLSYLQENPVFKDSSRCTLGEQEPEDDLCEKLDYVRHALITLGGPELGDVFSLSREEIKKTVNCLYTLIRQRQIDMEQKRKHSEVVLKYKNEIMIIQKKLELCLREKEKLQKECGKLENSLLTTKDQMRKSCRGEKNTREDFKQAVDKLSQKVTQVTHEMKKKESQVAKVQELYRKATKDSVLYKNNFDCTSRMESEGAAGILKKAGSSPKVAELCFMLKSGYEECQKRLLEENARLKECLELIQKELGEIINTTIEGLKHNMSERKELACLQPILLKPIVFQMPLGSIVQDIYQILRENLYRLRDALETIVNNS